MTLNKLTEKTESQTEKNWSRAFGWIGFVMFFAAIFETLVSMFWIGKEEISMSTFKIWFAVVGFVFALGNRQLGVFANNLGAIMIEKFNNFYIISW